MANKRNEHLVCVCGESGNGKSASLMFVDDPEGVLYLNTDISNPSLLKYFSTLSINSLKLSENFSFWFSLIIVGFL